MRTGDILVVYKLDRLCRSLRQLLNILERLDSAGVGFRSVTEPIDTGTSAGRLMLQMLGAMAEFERSLIIDRTMAGIDAARSRGVHLGRARSIPQSSVDDIVDRYNNDPRSPTIAQLAQEYEKDEPVILSLASGGTVAVIIINEIRI